MAVPVYLMCAIAPALAVSPTIATLAASRHQVSAISPALAPHGESAAVAPVLPRRRQLLAGLAAAAALERGGAAAAAEQKTFLITGASSGVGFAAAGELARRGHRVALACRTVEAASATARRLPEGATVWMPQKTGCALDDLGASAASRRFAAVVRRGLGSAAVVRRGLGSAAVSGPPPWFAAVSGFAAVSDTVSAQAP